MSQLPVSASPRERIALNKDLKLVGRSTIVDQRVRAVSPTSDRCMMLNRENGGGVAIQLCHCFGRGLSSKDKLMTNLEYIWGMTYKSLNLDTRYNCFFCDNGLHAMFDNGSWCLLADIKILERYIDAMERDGGRFGEELAKEMEKDDKKVHTYRFLCLHPRMRLTPVIFHDPENLDAEGRPKKRMIEFPGEFPPIHSHLHPKFVILSLGLQMIRTTHIPQSVFNQSHVNNHMLYFGFIRTLFNTWWTPATNAMVLDPKFSLIKEVEADEELILPGPQPEMTLRSQSHQGSASSGVTTRGQSKANGTRLQQRHSIANLKRTTQEADHQTIRKTRSTTNLAKTGRKAAAPNKRRGTRRIPEVKDTGKKTSDIIVETRIFDPDNIPGTDEEDNGEYDEDDNEDLLPTVLAKPKPNASKAPKISVTTGKRGADAYPSASGSLPPSPTTEAMVVRMRTRSLTRAAAAASATAAAAASASVRAPKKPRLGK
ncbi:hypothetical protein CVT24_010723 [Panaeolus cyanescens]|uniref:HNH nuclease domain-containing protein n=1 Tax=Panaeolus cyanescens TaxID=181874 RepID=A0A409YW02_9AGAR|nr:hypothetical protein CVT24_010723 [Panaeolus cyanescens]